MEYRCAATSVVGFIQQLAVNYVTHGYWHFVTGHVPAGKDPGRLDEKLVQKYGLAVSTWTRARRKRCGIANLQYIRHERFFVILATAGEHPTFFRDEARSLRDARKSPICYAGYAVSYRGGHAHVRIEQGELNRLRAHFLDRAIHRRPDAIANELMALPYVGYAPIRTQLYGLYLAINKRRQQMGYAPVPHGVLNFERPIVFPFGEAGRAASAGLAKAVAVVQGSQSNRATMRPGLVTAPSVPFHDFDPTESHTGSPCQEGSMGRTGPAFEPLHSAPALGVRCLLLDEEAANPKQQQGGCNHDPK